MPLVRVVIPTFNRASLVVEAVQTAQAQTFPDHEIVVVDDGSSDDTLERLKSLARDDRRIRVIAAEHGGVAAARNAGIAAPGDFKYVAFLDADDRWEPAHLSESLEVLEAEPEVSLISGAFETRDSTGTWTAEEFSHRAGKIRRMAELAARSCGPDKYILDPRRTFSAYVRGTVYPATPTVVVRASSVPRRRWFDPTLMVSEDSDFYLELAVTGAPWAYLGTVQCVVRFIGDNLTRSTDLSSPATLRKQRGSLECYRRRLAVCDHPDDRAHVKRELASRAYLVGQCCDQQMDHRGARDAYAESLGASLRYDAAKAYLATFLPRATVNAVKAILGHG